MRFELINKGLSLFLVLSVRPGARDLQAKPFLVEPTQQRAIPNVVLKLFCHIPMKFFGGPMDLIGFGRMLDQFSIFFAFVGTDLTRPTASRMVQKSVNAALIEPSHPPGECTSGNTIQGTHLLVGETEQQGLYGNAPNISTLPRCSSGGHFQLSKRAILRIGHVRLTSHAQDKPHPKSDREKNRTTNRSLFLSFAIGGQIIDTSTPTGKFFITVMAGAAELERSLINERCNEGRKRRRAEGRRIGEVPYGYDLAEDGKNLIPNELQQGALKLISSLRKKGKSLREIATELNKRGIQAKKGGSWTYGQIQSALATINRAA